MRNLKIVISLIICISINGCMSSRNITEKHIKTSIEKHAPGDYSSINIYTIFKGVTIDRTGYLELTGYKYDNKKGLVIGADKYYLLRQNFKGDYSKLAEITYINLSLAQCKAIIYNYEIIESKIQASNPIANEEIYHDYTVSDDLFISFKSKFGSSSQTSSRYIYFWINGEKFQVSTYKIMKKLVKFINY
jgi:hypothetical protein